MDTRSANSDSPPFRRAAIAMLLILAATGAWVWRLSVNPNVVILSDTGSAHWLRVDRPFETRANRNRNTAAVFAARVWIPQSRWAINLGVTALRRVMVELDDRRLFDSGPDLKHWKTLHTVPVPSDVPAGWHILRCIVSNEDGPALLRVNCPELKLGTDSTWLASQDGKHWLPAAPAEAPWEPVVPTHLQPTGGEMIAIVPWLLGLLTLAIFVAARVFTTVGTRNRLVLASRLRWLLLAGWVLLALNNLFKIPLACGYDVQAHYDYILYVKDHLSLPRPDAGWQFFQAPLYYILSAGIWRVLFSVTVQNDTAMCLLRLIPLICGAMILQISYQAGRLVFPARGDLQIVTMLAGGLVPVNLYMSQTVSNEPLAAAFSSLLFLQILKLVLEPQRARSSTTLALAGLMLGLACLTKISAMVWSVPLVLAVGIALAHESSDRRQWLKQCLTRGVILAAAPTLMVGAMLIHNRLQTGRFLFLQSSNENWWQDPGYRIPSNFFEFGRVFARPVYNITASVWDSLYGTLWGAGIPSVIFPWHPGLMWCGLWLALVPTGLMFLGACRAATCPDPAVRRCLQLCMLTLACFIAAILNVYLTLPIYSCAKASYMLSAMPCVGLLTAAGFERITHRTAKTVAGGTILCWAVTAYLTFFVVL